MLSKSNMLNSNFLEVIKEIHSKLSKEKITYAIVGSTNMALHGMDVSPKDLDIVIGLGDLDRIPLIFKEKVIKNKTSLAPLVNRPAWEVILKINQIEIQFLGENADGEYNRELKKENLDLIQVDNLKVPCFKLEVDSKVYSRTNRQNKADLINKFLKDQTPK